MCQRTVLSTYDNIVHTSAQKPNLVGHNVIKSTCAFSLRKQEKIQKNYPLGNNSRRDKKTMCKKERPQECKPVPPRAASELEVVGHVGVVLRLRVQAQVQPRDPGALRVDPDRAAGAHERPRLLAYVCPIAICLLITV